MAATEPIRDKRQFTALAEYYLKRGQLRNYTLIIMGAYTALMISDLLRLRWADVYSETLQVFYSRVTITEKKTKRSVVSRRGGSVSPVVIMDIYNPCNYEVTRRYPGMAQDDLDEAYLGMELL